MLRFEGTESAGCDGPTDGAKLLRSPNERSEQGAKRIDAWISLGGSMGAHGIALPGRRPRQLQAFQARRARKHRMVLSIPSASALPVLPLYSKLTRWALGSALRYSMLACDDRVRRVRGLNDESAACPEPGSEIVRFTRCIEKRMSRWPGCSAAQRNVQSKLAAAKRLGRRKRRSPPLSMSGLLGHALI